MDTRQDGQIGARSGTNYNHLVSGKYKKNILQRNGKYSRIDRFA